MGPLHHFNLVKVKLYICIVLYILNSLIAGRSTTVVILVYVSVTVNLLTTYHGVSCVDIKIVASYF